MGDQIADPWGRSGDQTGAFGVTPVWVVLGSCVSYDWSTMLTNDFKGLLQGDRLAPFSLVCKAVSANGGPTVKLSDNLLKAMGPESEIARYKRVFGVG